MSEFEHKKNAPSLIHYSIITISDTRNFETDKSGHFIRNLLQQNDAYALVDHKIVPDDFQQISLAIQDSLNSSAEVLLLNGGTGISSRDGTYEVVSQILEKKLDGFGELFRFLSYKEIGSASILSRAIGGTIGKKAIFSMPGSTNAVSLAMNSILLDEIPHVLSELKKKS